MFTRRTAVTLLGDQASIPAERGTWGNERGDLRQALTSERISEHSEAPALSVGAVQAAPTELGFEEAIFFAPLVPRHA